MESMKEMKRSKVMDLFTNPFYIKCIWVIIGLLTAVPIIRIHIEHFIKIILIWGLLVLAYLFFTKKLNLKKIEMVLLVLFSVSYAITIVLNFGKHTGEEISLFMYTVTFFFLLTWCDRDKKAEQIRKEVLCLFKIIAWMTFVFATICLVMYFASVQSEIIIEKSIFPVGMWEGRLWGIYNPNTGAVLNYISMIVIVLILQWEKKSKKLKILYWINFAIQACCFVLTQSRGATVALYVFLVLYIIFVRKNKFSFNGLKDKGYRLLLAVVTVVLLRVGYDLALSGLQIVKEVPYRIIYTLNGEEDTEQKLKEKDQLAKREVDKSNAASETSGRSDLWKLGIEAFSENPVFGIGNQSIDDVLKEGLSKKWYDNSARGGLHNIYITVLVSAGAMGTLFLLAYWAVILWKGLKYELSAKSDRFGQQLLVFIPAWLAGDLVESRIVLSTGFLAIVFWIVIGYSMYFLGRKTGEK